MNGGWVPPDFPVSVGEPLPVVRLQQFPLHFSGLSATDRLVIRSQAEWQAVWASVWQATSPPPPLPAIDFTREMIIVAPLGQQVTGGYDIYVDTAFETTSGVTIAIRSVVAGAGCPTLPVVTQPVDIARLPRRDGPIVFEERAQINQCSNQF